MVTTLVAALSVLLAQQPPRDAARGTPVGGTATITGVVVTGDTDVKPVRRARVTISDGQRRAGATIVTDDAGRFAFRNVSAGRYMVTASKNAWVGIAYGATRPGRPGTPIAIAEGQEVALVLKMARGAVITGVVTDEHGQPMPRTTVIPLRYVFQNGVRTLNPAGSNATSDDRGVYRLYGLAPGQYVVGANAHRPTTGDIRRTTDADIARALAERRGPDRGADGGPARADDGGTVNHAPVFFPGTTSPAQATTIALEPGEERAGIDFPIGLVPTSRIEGVVVTPDGTAAANNTVNLLSGETGIPGFGLDMFRTTRTTAEGRFTFSGLPPGRYTVMSRAAAPGEEAPRPRAGPFDMTTPSFWAMSDVTLDGQPAGGITLILQPGLTVSGRIQYSGSLPQPDMARLRVSLGPVSMPGQVNIGVPPAPVRPDGTFTITGVVPGTYRFSATLPGVPPDQPGWTLGSAVANGRDTLDVPLDLRESIADVVLTFTDRAGELTGMLQHADGRPAPEYHIILFAAERGFWTPHSRRIRAGRPSADGRFTFYSVPAGDYLLAAVTDIEPGEWLDPTVLQRLAPGAMSIRLAEGEKKVQDIQIGR